MASVESALTPITVNSVARSFCGCAGSAAASARAAEAPQIAVAPPVSRPNKGWKPMARATIIASPMVSATDSTTSRNGCQPSATTCAAVMRRPSSATPTRSSVRPLKAITGAQGPAAERKFIAMPSSRANSITGAP